MRHEVVAPRDFQVLKQDIGSCRFISSSGGETGELADGQLLLAIDRFALTANNITYANFGQEMSYWKFFPAADEKWGRIPVWGFADVIQSTAQNIEVGARVFGFLPISTQLIMQAGAISKSGFVDQLPHRQALHGVYNQYQIVSKDPDQDGHFEDLQMLWRPLFITSFLIDDFLADSDFFGAGSIILSSASSKTAMGLAYLLRKNRSEKCKVIGLTSSAYLDHVKSLGCYHQVVDYRELAALSAKTPVVYVDMAGNAQLRHDIHHHFGDQLQHDCVVGNAHGQKPQASADLPGARPEFFFAPARIQKRERDWGRGGVMRQFASSWTAFLPTADEWLQVVRQSGEAAVERVYLDLLNGQVRPGPGYGVEHQRPRYMRPGRQKRIDTATIEINTMKKLLPICLLLCCVSAAAQNVQTLRVDYYHSGNALTEMFSLHQVVVEPLPWPGKAEGSIDTSNRGSYLFEVVEPLSNKVFYSRGFGSIFGEWQFTAEAKTMNRTLHESVRFPMPEQAVRLRISKRDDANRFAAIWTVMIDPDGLHVVRKSAPPVGEILAITSNGAPADKVDLLFIGDGYTEMESALFEADVRRLSGDLFSISPFSDYASKFNVWAINPAAAESGSNRPSNGTYRYSPIGATYDAFGAERYVLAFDNLGLREIAQHAPYEHIIILTNMKTYGGGGIFNLYATVAAHNDWASYLMIHEFAHSFAGLADEYYTSPDVYDSSSPLRPEPWEPNVTALHYPNHVKWADWVDSSSTLPNDWPKDQFEAFQKDNQAHRAQLRADRRPEAEMSALFKAEQSFIEKLFSEVPNSDAVGAFEGANYQAQGYYRSAMNCMMFTRADYFCEVCKQGIEEIILLYTER